MKCSDVYPLLRKLFWVALTRPHWATLRPTRKLRSCGAQFRHFPEMRNFCSGAQPLLYFRQFWGGL